MKETSVPPSISEGQKGMLDILTRETTWRPLVGRYPAGAVNSYQYSRLAFDIYAGFALAIKSEPGPMAISLERMKTKDEPKNVVVAVGERLFPIRFKLRDGYLVVGKALVNLRHSTAVLATAQALALAIASVTASL